MWRTFRPFFEKLENIGPPVAVLGHSEGGKHGKARWIEILAVVFKNTLDNQDIRGSEQAVSRCVSLQRRVYLTFKKFIYEDERIPHFNITQRATDEDSTSGKAAEKEWRQSKILKNDEIDFDVVKRWITVCKTEHGSRCHGHERDKTLA